MKVSNLYNKFCGQTIYILGTGPSAKFFPFRLLSGQVVIGLNAAYQLYDRCTFNLTIHPELIPKDFHTTTKQIWITKRKDWLASGYARKIDQCVYWFTNNSDLKDYNNLTSVDDSLYVGRGIATAALSLTAKMGAYAAVLVGCDMSIVHPKGDSRSNLTHDRGCQIDSIDPHYIYYQSVNKPTQFHGLNPKDVVKEYYLSLREVQKRLPDLKVLSLIPYCAAEYWKEEYLELEKDLPFQVQDTSKYQRSKPDFP